MLRDIDNYFLQKQEPIKSCLLFIREYILTYDTAITEAWKYRMPFYCYKGKMLCYLWTNKITGQPYIGFVDGKLIQHPDLLVEKRSRIKILMIDPLEDMPVEIMKELLSVTLQLRNSTLKS